MIRTVLFLSISLFFWNNVCLARNIKIGITQIVSHPALDRNCAAIKEGLAKSGLKIDIEFQNAQGKPTLAAEIARRFASDRDIVVALGTTSAQAFLPFKDKKLTVVFSSITDPLGAGLVKDLQKPEASFTGLSNFVSAQRQVAFIKEVLGKTSLKLGILYNPGDSNSLAALKDSESIQSIENVQFVRGAATNLPDLLNVARKLIGEVDALFIHNDNLALSGISGILRIANAAKKPVFTSDVESVPLGVLGAVGPDQASLGQQTAEMVIAFLKGKKVAETPVAFPRDVLKCINVKQAKKLGIKISEKTLASTIQVEKS